MRSLRRFSFLLASLLPVMLAARDLRVTSPNGRIVFTFTLTTTAPTYRITFDGRPVVDPSALTLTFQEGGIFGPALRQQRPSVRVLDEPYSLVVGKVRSARNHCREALIPLVEPGGRRRQINLQVRVFDDGVAFRYVLPTQSGWTNYALTDERTTFRLPQNPTVLGLLLPSFTTSHEGLYTRVALDSLRADTLMDMPALFTFPDRRAYLAITEAALSNYAGMYLSRKGGVLTSQLSPLPGQTGALDSQVKVKATLPHQTPWRVLLIGDRPGTLIESNILTSLNEPSKIGDAAWLKPGKTTFPWWNGTVLPDTTFAPGNNFETNKYYIDFCADNHIDYHSVVEYGGHEWYVGDGVGYAPGPHSDASKAVPGLDMQQVCDYARQRGVGIRVWVYWSVLYPHIDEVFAQYERWGVQGLMVDFMDRDDQEMVQIQERILQKAAEHHLHIQFHGAYKPTGMHRTYPNELTREGTLNYEVNKWATTMTPDHDINFPFTRMLAGATDMHLGGFRAVPENQFQVHYIRPYMHGTRCHQLAMYPALETYLSMVADYPDAYKGQPGFEFITQVPTVWDEVRVPLAEVSQYITIARRNGTDWFVGTLTNSQPRTLTLPLNFLPEGRYTAEIYSDAPDVAQNPNHLTKETRTVTRADVLTLQLAAGGGHAMRLQRVNE